MTQQKKARPMNRFASYTKSGEFIGYVSEPSTSNKTIDVLRKDICDEYMADVTIRRKDFEERWNITGKQLGKALRFHYTPDELKKSRRLRVQNSQRRFNSNTKNFNKPRVIIDKEYLKEMLDEGMTYNQMALNCGVSCFVIKSNIAYHCIDVKDYVSISKHFTHLDLKMLKDLEVFGHYLIDDIIKRDFEALKPKLKNLYDDIMDLRDLAIKLRLWHPDSIPVAKTKGERIFEKFLKEENIPYELQFTLGGKIYDFRIGSNLVEIDGASHTQEADEIKNKIAECHGFNIIRIDAKELTQKSFKRCLENLKSSLLSQLV